MNNSSDQLSIEVETIDVSRHVVKWTVAKFTCSQTI